MRKQHPLEVVTRAASQFDSALVSFSCGKDALATLDLCWGRFRKVHAFYMYITPDLSFHQRAIARACRRYPGLVVHQIPHWMLSRLLRSHSLRHPTLVGRDTPLLSLADCEAHARRLSGVEWVAAGHKRHDSLERVGMLNRCDSIDAKGKRFYPLAWWSNASVLAHLKRRKIPLSDEYAVMGSSYGGDLYGDSLAVIREYFPDDYRKILQRFPHAEAEAARRDIHEPWSRRRGWGRKLDDFDFGCLWARAERIAAGVEVSEVGEGDGAPQPDGPPPR